MIEMLVVGMPRLSLKRVDAGERGQSGCDEESKHSGPFGACELVYVRELVAPWDNHQVGA